MSVEVVTAAIVGLTGLLALFFGSAFWIVFSGLIEDLKNEVDRLQDVTRKQRDRLDKLEDQLHKRQIQLLQVEANLDNYVNSAQLLTNENKDLRQKVKELQDENLQLRSTLAQLKQSNP